MTTHFFVLLRKENFLQQYIQTYMQVEHISAQASLVRASYGTISIGTEAVEVQECQKD